MFGFTRNKKQTELSDTEVIEGLQHNDRSVERSFYLSCQRYFKDRRSGVFDLSEGAQEEQDLFQDSFLSLWQEIQARRIYVRDNYAWRTDRSGNDRRMSASLKTYLMAIAKYKNYEMLREEDIYVPEQNNISDKPMEEADEDTSQWIVEQCVNMLPPRCKEILTLFYYEGKSLDEILVIRNENQSKDGLKTGKSKCMKTLKEKITAQFKLYNLKPYGYV